MFEIQMSAMKGEAANRVQPAAVVFYASGNRMAAFGEMDADLVLPACFQPHFDERGFRPSLHDVHVSDGRLSPLSLFGVEYTR